MSSSFALSSCTKRLRLDQPHRTASHCNALHCNGAGIKSSLCCEEEESLQVYVLQKASKRSRILPLDISSENAESRRCASVDRIDIPHHRKSCILYSVSGEVPMSLLDETAGSPEAGPSNTAGRVGAIPQAKTRVKKRARRSQKTDAVDAVDPAAASPSHAAYAAPASEVRRYSHGKPVSAKTVRSRVHLVWPSNIA